MDFDFGPAARTFLDVQFLRPQPQLTKMTTVDNDAEAGPSKPAAVAATKSKKGKLIRPRGKRGGKKHHRSTPTPAKAAKAASTSSSSAARTQHSLRIAHFHRLEKEKARLLSAREREEEGDDAARATRLAEIEAEQEALGGLDAYQDDSLTGSASHRGGESGKWLAQQMIKQLGGKQEVRTRVSKAACMRLILHSSHSLARSSTS